MIEIAIIPGDGIGPEVIASALPVLEWAKAQGLPLSWTPFPYGADHYLATGEILSERHFLELQQNVDGILFGAVGDPRIPDGRHAEGLLLRLRQSLELTVNFRPCSPILDDFVLLRDRKACEIQIEVFRENTEGPYCLQGESGEERCSDFAIHTRNAVEPLLRAAFERAAVRGCGLTLAHKANVLKHGHGLWIRLFEELKADYPSVPARGMHADALLCELVRDPRPFGVLAADNYLGDLISDLLAAFQGGMGMAPSLSWAPHHPYRCQVLAEPVHGSAPNLTGKNVANPLGAILSLALMLRHLGFESQGHAVELAVGSALKKGASTMDLGGSLGCSEMAQAVMAELA